MNLLTPSQFILQPSSFSLFKFRNSNHVFVCVAVAEENFPLEFRLVAHLMATESAKIHETKSMQTRGVSVSAWIFVRQCLFNFAGIDRTDSIVRRQHTETTVAAREIRT